MVNSHTLGFTLCKSVLAILRRTNYTKKEMRNIMAKKLIFATNNQGKVNEIRQIMGEAYDVYSLKDLDIQIGRASGRERVGM